MALADQEYMQPAEHRAGARPEIDSITTWLIVLCIAAYIIDRLLVRAGIFYVVDIDEQRIYFAPLYHWGYFSQHWAVRDFQIWRFVTFQFLHANLDHLIFNMVALYFFGPMVEAYLSSRQFLVYYLLCGVGGGVMYLILLTAGLRVGSSWVPLVGASAGIFGVLIAATLIAPRTEALVFGIIPMPLRTLAWLFIGYAIFTVLFRGSNAGGEAAHLGGAAVGFVLMRNPALLERAAWGGRRAPPF
ncbi:MAG: rhomboid family intramembrane serine protease [Tepidisphaeraceae bacterium]